MTDCRLQHLGAVIRRRICFFFNTHLLTCITAAVLLILLPRITWAHQVTLAWDPNADPDIAGYITHWGTSSGDYTHLTDVGNTTMHTIRGLEENQVYYFAVTAYDSEYNESDYSEELAHTISSSPANSSRNYSGGGGGGGCYIATADFRSPMANVVTILREFRDKILPIDGIGRAAVLGYYNYFPTLADYMAAHNKIRKFVYWSPLPAPGLCWLIVKPGIWMILAAYFLLPGLMAVIPAVVRRRQ